MADAAGAERSEQQLAAEGVDTSDTGLQRALANADLAIRAEAAFLLGARGVSEAEDALRTALDDRDARVRVEAARALASLGHRDEGSRVLRRELDGVFFEDAPIRAARALASLGDPAGYTRVQAGLSSAQPAERMETVITLPAFLPFTGQTLDDLTIDPVPLLIAALDDDSEVVHDEVVRNLQLIDDERARAALGR